MKEVGSCCNESLRARFLGSREASASGEGERSLFKFVVVFEVEEIDVTGSTGGDGAEKRGRFLASRDGADGLEGGGEWRGRFPGSWVLVDVDAACGGGDSE